MYAGALRIKHNVHIVLGITLKQVYLCVQVLGQRWESVRLWIDSSNVSLCSEIIIIPRVVESKDYGGQKSICSLPSKFLSHALINQQPRHNLWYSGIQRETQLACLWLVTFWIKLFFLHVVVCCQITCANFPSGMLRVPSKEKTLLSVLFDAKMIV